MAYADPADQQAAGRRHYEANRERYMAQNLARRARNQAHVTALKANPCVDCGCRWPQSCSHHVDPHRTEAGCRRFPTRP